MEQFNLEEWLKDKSRKVVTRDGRKVEILKVDAKGNHPIIGIYQFSEAEDMESSWCIDGRKTENGESSFDLFFADDEEDKFETTMISFSHVMFDHLLNSNVKVDVKEWKIKLLDLARKEIEKDIEHSAIEFAKSYMEDVNPSFEKVQESEELWKWKISCLRGINKAYTQGKQDALKDLPKLKKAEKDDELDCQQNDRVVPSDFVQKDEYYITFDALIH